LRKIIRINEPLFFFSGIPASHIARKKLITTPQPSKAMNIGINEI